MDVWICVIQATQLGSHEGGGWGSGAAIIRPGRIPGRSLSGEAAAELVGELPDIPAHEKQKAAW